MKLLLITTLFSLIPGQLVRLPIFGVPGAITLTDIIVTTTVLFFLINALHAKKTLKLPKATFVAFALFTTFAAASTVYALNTLSQAEFLSSIVFLVRFILYFTIAFIVGATVKRREISSWVDLILLIGVIFTIAGFLQYFLFPDLSAYTIYGWDPHQKRIFSTLLDPNYTGAIFVILLSLSLSKYLFQRKFNYLIVALFTLVAIIFTFSRSAYLATFTAILTISFLKSPKLIILFIAFAISAFLLLGQVRNRVVGALTIDDTSQARIESWKNAIKIFSDNKLIGVGFNSYRFAQARYGNFSYELPLGGNSGGGSDSSLLLVAATTGIFGLGFYILLLVTIGNTFLKNIKENYLKLASFSIFLALIVDSQFVNSLFYPQIMLLMFTIYGLNLANDS